MSYSGTMTAADWTCMIQIKAQSMVGITEEGLSMYKKWYDYAYGKTMSEIGTALGISENQATALDQAFGVLNEIHNAMNNVAVSTADRKTKLLVFY